MARFLRELRRRNVIKVGGVYAVVGFVLLQVADLLFPALLLPDWSFRLLAVFALMGFPVALVLAWAFEVTPEGVKRASEPRPASGAAGSGSAARPSGGSSIWRRTAYVGFGALLLLAGLGGWAYFGRPDQPDPDEGRRFASIAVLPFADMSQGGDQAWFSDGLSEELLNLLARVEGLQVAARTSSFAYGSEVPDIRTVGRDLGVEAVLEGSVRKSGDRVRITAQLIGTATGYHLWSDTFDRDDTDVFATQDEIAAAIVTALGFDEAVDAPAVERYTENVAAYELYLQGRFEQRRIFEVAWEDGEAQALASNALFERALALDSTYALPWAGIADTHTQYLADNFWAPSRAYPPGRDAALRALALDPDLSEAHVSLALVKYWFNWDYEGADASLRRAIDLDPDNPSAHSYRALVLRRLGRMGEALKEATRAAAIDPTRFGFLTELSRVREKISRGEEIVADSVPTAVLAQALFEAGRVEELEELAPGLHEEFPLPPAAELRARPLDMARYGYIGWFLDRPMYADSVFRTLVDVSEERYVSPDLIAALDATLGRPDSALVWLDRAFKARSAYLADGILDWAWFNSLRGDPRFEAFQRRVRP